MGIHLHRSSSQRRFGAVMTILYTLGSLMAVGLVIGPWTYLSGADGIFEWTVGAAGVLAVVALGQFARVSYRLATSPPGEVELGPDELVIRDRSVFRDSLRLRRSDIASISPAPAARDAFSAHGVATQERGPLVSLVPEPPNVLVRLTQPKVFEIAKWNQGLTRRFAVLPPSPAKAAYSVWLRTETPAGRDELIAWHH